MRFMIIAGACLTLAGCGGSNAALMASGGPADFAAMGRTNEVYGGGDAIATVPITVEGQQYAFKIWISKDGRRIMAQTASLAGAAAAGFVRGLTAGLSQGDLEYEPYRLAAQTYLDQARAPGCTLQIFQKLAHIGWEWDFNCDRAHQAQR